MSIPSKNNKPTIPSYDEVMQGLQDEPQVPSFNEVMGEKKNSDSALETSGNGLSKHSNVVFNGGNLPSGKNESGQLTQERYDALMWKKGLQPQVDKYMKEHNEPHRDALSDAEQAELNNFSAQGYFGMKPIKDLAAGQQSRSENTASVGAGQTISSQEGIIHHDEIVQRKKDLQEKIQKATPIAISNAAKKSLNIKGLNPNNVALLNTEKANFQKQLDNGDATVGFGNDGEVGLINHPGAWDSFHSHMKAAIDENKNSREFAKMSIPERVAFAKKQQEESQSPYLRERPEGLASVAAMAGGTLPTLALYGAGAAAGGVLEAAAPETGFLSTLALKPVMSFVTNAGSDANKKGMEGTLSRYQLIKNKNPEMSDEEAMMHAGKGEDVDRLAGIAEAALFSTVGGELKLGKSATGNLLKGMAKSGVDVGAKTALVTGAQDVGHNIEGVTHKSGSEILGDMANTFGENAPMGAALHGFMGVISGAAKVPELIKSALKYDVVTKMPPERVQADLAANVNSGAITPDEADKATNDLNEFTNALKKTHDNSPDNVKASVAGLILKRDNILKGAEGKDKTTQALLKQQTDAIDNQINGIYRTGKPLEHEINPNTGTTFKQPTFDDDAKAKVEYLAKKISKGDRVEDPEDLQTQANFPDELEKQLQRISKEEKSSQKDKENPNTDLSDNIEKYQKKVSAENDIDGSMQNEFDQTLHGVALRDYIAYKERGGSETAQDVQKRFRVSYSDASDIVTKYKDLTFDKIKAKYATERENILNENQTTKVPNTETQGSITNEGANQIKQSTERTAGQIKKISREKIDMDNIDKKVTIHDIDSYKSGSKELPLKEVTAFEGRDILRKRLKAIDNIIKCL